MFNHLIDIERLSTEEISDIISTAQAFKKDTITSCAKGKTVCLMFFENSTRTHCSFELAAKKLKMHVLNFDIGTSSFSKGESIKDTFENLYFIGVDAVILRHSENKIIDRILENISYPLKFVNAGDGNCAHPTQALLDYMTMLEKIGSVEGKKIVIAGDVAHSRVAKSNLALLKRFGAEVHFCAPEYFMPENPEKFNVIWHDNPEEAISGADVVMLLRVQNERLDSETVKKCGNYSDKYKLSSEILNKYAPNAVLMHPGPVNREVEITSELLDSTKGVTILEQARNGLFVRMAVLNKMFGEKDE